MRIILCSWQPVALGFSAFLCSGEFTVKSLKAHDPSWDMPPDDIAVDITA